jgi:hypothetical protein
MVLAPAPWGRYRIIGFVQCNWGGHCYLYLHLFEPIEPARGSKYRLGRNANSNCFKNIARCSSFPFHLEQDPLIGLKWLNLYILILLPLLSQSMLDEMKTLLMVFNHHTQLQWQDSISIICRLTCLPASRQTNVCPSIVYERTLSTAWNIHL